jgi:hypothetical protein
MHYPTVNSYHSTEGSTNLHFTTLLFHTLPDVLKDKSNIGCIYIKILHYNLSHFSQIQSTLAKWFQVLTNIGENSRAQKNIYKKRKQEVCFKI